MYFVLGDNLFIVLFDCADSAPFFLLNLFAVAIKKIDTAGRRMLLLRGAIGTSCANLAAAIVLKIGRENRSDDFETDQVLFSPFFKVSNHHLSLHFLKPGEL